MKVPFLRIQLRRLSYPLSRLPIGQTAPPAVTPQQWTCAVTADGISVPNDLEGHRNGPGCPF
jgi:hypothetical protein